MVETISAHAPLQDLVEELVRESPVPSFVVG
jgi:hypothetical protein